MEDAEESLRWLLRGCSGPANIPSTHAAGTSFQNQSKEHDFGRIQGRAAITLLLDPEGTNDSVHPTVPEDQGLKSANDLHMLQWAGGKQDELGGTSRGCCRTSPRTMSVHSSSMLTLAFRSLHYTRRLGRQGETYVPALQGEPPRPGRKRKVDARPSLQREVCRMEHVLEVMRFNLG